MLEHRSIEDDLNALLQLAIKYESSKSWFNPTLVTRDTSSGKKKTKKIKSAQWNKESKRAYKPSEEEHLTIDRSDDHNIRTSREDPSEVIPTSNHDTQQDSFNGDTRDHKCNTTHEITYKKEQMTTQSHSGIITITHTQHVEASEIRDTPTEKTRKETPIGKHAITKTIITARRIKTKDPIKNKKSTTMVNDKETIVQTEIISTIWKTRRFADKRREMTICRKRWRQRRKRSI